MWIWKIVLILIIFGLNPLLMGFMVTYKGESWKKLYINGVLGQWGIFELLCVLCTLLKTTFHIVVYVYAGILILIDVYAVLKKKNTIWNKIRWREKEDDRIVYLLVVVVIGLILFQALMLGMGQHEDLDDASYITASTTTLETDSMYQFNHQTGDRAEKLDLKRALSAFPQYFAFISFVTKIHPATIARTLYPLWAIPFAYVIYGTIGDKLFGVKKLYKWLFLLFFCVFNIFGFNSVYTSSSFLLLRIWQGKATLVAIVIPYLWYQCWELMEQKQMKRREWLCLEMGILSACMTTTMGVMLAPIICGIFAIVYSIWNRNFHIVWKTVLSCMPCIALAGVYLFLR